MRLVLALGQAIGCAAPSQAVVPKPSTTTVQEVVSEVLELNEAAVIVESDISRPDLLAAISDHLVNGTPLCPSSIYADMAVTIGKHRYKFLRPETETVHMNICKMEVFNPFIANDNGGK